MGAATSVLRQFESYNESAIDRQRVHVNQQPATAGVGIATIDSAAARPARRNAAHVPIPHRSRRIVIAVCGYAVESSPLIS
jgi:hypothetical protein